jgi:hypothetical protein
MDDGVPTRSGVHKDRMNRHPGHRERVGALRRATAKVALVAAVGLVAAAFGEQLPQSEYAALAALLFGACVAVIIGSMVAWLLASSYHQDRDQALGALRPFWGYVSRAGAWGLAAAGIGALLTTALPGRLAQAPTDPRAIPIAGWMAIIFGSVGIAFGILEEWRSPPPVDPPDPPSA